MRTTINIDDDLLIAAQDLARDTHRSLGSVLSDLVRQGFERPIPPSEEIDEELAALGIFPLPKRGRVVTNELVNRIRDEEGI